MKNSFVKKLLKFKSNNSQANVVGTLLLILITISIATFILPFVVSFVRNQLSNSDCFNIIDELEILNNPKYTCYKSSANNLFVQIRLKNRENIKGFIIELADLTTKTYKIKDNIQISGIKMYDGSSVLELPEENEERTYNITIASKPQLIRIYPIHKNGKICPSSDSITSISECS